MTEKDWLRSASAEKMVACLCSQFGAARSKGGRRKLRLLACACCRRIWDRLDERDREVLLVSEKFADGLASAKELETARQGWTERSRHVPGASTAALATGSLQPRMAEKWARFYVCATIAGHGSRRPTRWVAEEAVHAAIVREIFGNPFDPPRIDKTWLRWNDRTIPRIAMGIDEERAFDRMPILADALLDAGCDNEELLAHCRSPGPHVRGCWVIDLILGKE